MIELYRFLNFQVHGNADGHGGGFSKGVEELLTFIESLVNMQPVEMFAALLPGVAAMSNIHPLVVHFPIALLSLFILLDVFGWLLRKQAWRRFAGGLLYLGTVTAGLAVIAGLIAEETVAHGQNVHEILEKHELFGFSILTLSAVLSIWRFFSGGLVKGAANILYFLFSIILMVLIIIGADLGGLMVYKYGVAVEAVEKVSQQHFHEHNHSH